VTLRREEQEPGERRRPEASGTKSLTSEEVSYIDSYAWFPQLTGFCEGGTTRVGHFEGWTGRMNFKFEISNEATAQSGKKMQIPRLRSG
jgi:hypothetical protein